MEQIHGGNIYELKNGGKSVLDFSANINPLGMPEGIKNAVISALDNSSRYPDIKTGRLLRALAELHHVKEENIIIGNGAADIIYSLCFAMKFKRALIMDPTFGEYKKALRASGTITESICLNEESKFSFTDENLAQITGDFDALFICQPNNPTGILTSGEMLEKIVSRCSENNVLIVIDECFLEFIDEAERYSLINHLADGNVIILKSFTKLYAMAGIRLGYALCGNAEIIEKINSCRQPWSVSNLAEEAGLQALNETSFVKASLKFIKDEKHFLLNEFKKLGLKVYGSSANYIFFYSEDTMLYEHMLERGILIRSCKSYKTIPDGFYRIAVRSHEENVQLIKELKLILKGD